MAYPPYGALGAAQQSMPSRNIAFDKPETEAAFHKAISSASNQVAAPSFTDDLAAALARLDQVIGVTSADADNIRERLFGGWPEAGSSGAAKPSYPGMSGALLDTVQAITDRAVRLSETVQVLNARI